MSPVPGRSWENRPATRKNHKSTYVSLLGIEASQALADRYYEEAMQQIKGLHADTQELLSFLKELKDRRH